MSKGLTLEDYERVMFHLKVGFAREHNLSNLEDFKRLIAEKGQLYFDKWMFNAFCDLEGIMTEKQWRTFLKENPEVPRA
jgi:hypothetical protein